MQQVNLGQTSLHVSVMGMGGASLSVQGRPSEEQSLRTIEAALDCGITLFDTADSYSLNEHDLGHNEQLFQKAFDSRGASDLLLVTKGGLIRPDGQWDVDARPHALRAACEQSLLRLKRDSHPLYLLHAPDPDVPIEESVGELSRMQEEGLIQHIGLSNVNEEQLANVLSFTRIECVQNRFHLFDRRSQAVLDLCEQQQISLLCYSPLGSATQLKRLIDHQLLQQLSEKHEATPPQIALAWLTAYSSVIIPIIGTSRPETIRNSADAVHVRLDAADIAQLNEI
ncbi:aldo/keto reductase [Paenibacillus sp. 481]|nr:aldo/keto reductase [Paenibacillus sp. 481]